MSRITKDAAGIVAQKMTENMRRERDVLHAKISEELEKLVKKELPDEVRNTFEKYPDYFKINSFVQLRSDKIKILGSFSLTKIEEDKTRPRYVVYPAGHQPVIEKVSDKEAKKINEMMDRHESLEKRCGKLYQDLKILLYNMRTYAKVSEMLPEAVPFLPAIQKSQGLSIDIGDIRNRLQNY